MCGPIAISNENETKRKRCWFWVPRGDALGVGPHESNKKQLVMGMRWDWFAQLAHTILILKAQPTRILYESKITSWSLMW